MNRNTDGSRLIGDCSCDCLTDPPCRIGTEFVTFTIIKFLDSFDQAKVTFLNQIQEQHTTSHVSFGNADYQTEVGFCQTFLCFLIALFHTLCKLNFFVCRKKAYLTDLFQIHTNRIFNADTFRNRKIDLVKFDFFLVIHLFDVGIVIHIKYQFFIIS